MELQYCPKCISMTNHNEVSGQCLRCKSILSKDEPQPEADRPMQIPAVIGTFDGLEKLITKEIIVEALQDSWNDFCEDTGCHPDCFQILDSFGTKYLEARFDVGSFSDSVRGQIIYLLNKRLNDTPSNGR